METVDAIVIGAGVVGLAIARALAMTGRQTLVLEGERHFGSWTSSRNSEVIHAGLYYPEGSLKASLCVAGRGLLYEFCRTHAVPHRRLGKIVFAHNDAQLPALEAILRNAAAAGVTDVQPLSRREAADLEPALSCIHALLSPSTGIVDSHAFMLALVVDAEAYGAMLVYESPVRRISLGNGNLAVHLAPDGPPVVAAPILINAAGLGAQTVARSVDGMRSTDVPPLHLARGIYFTYSGKVPFSRLIYPVPEPGGLGTHLTLDMSGQAKFGPDIEWIDAIDYTVDTGRRARFTAAALRIWPKLDPSKLHPGYAGIRPKLSGPLEAPSDFLVSGPAAHGVTGLINLFGIESPGLTASLAIAEHVVSLMG